MTWIEADASKGKNAMIVRRMTLAFAAVLVAGPALAHPGHGTGFATGFLHPVTGADHLLAMVAVGLWAALAAPRLFLVAPVGFMTGMLLGGAAGMSGLTAPGTELMIGTSVVVFGVLTALMVRVPAAAAFGAAALFGTFHGLAHGAEMPANAGGAAFAGGFIFATALLHASGASLGLLTQRLAQPSVARAIGWLVAAAGATILAVG